MKVDNSGKPLSIPPSKSSDVKTRAQSADAPAVQSDSVEINPAATKLQALEAKLTSQPAFDAAKVEEIKSAIASGKFSIRPEVIADRLMASVKELLQQDGR